MVTLTLCVLFAVFVHVNATIFVSKDGSDVEGCGTDSGPGACLTLQFLFNNRSFSDEVVSVLPGIYDIKDVRITQKNISIIAASEMEKVVFRCTNGSASCITVSNTIGFVIEAVVFQGIGAPLLKIQGTNVDEPLSVVRDDELVIPNPGTHIVRGCSFENDQVTVPSASSLLISIVDLPVNKLDVEDQGAIFEDCEFSDFNGVPLFSIDKATVSFKSLSFDSVFNSSKSFVSVSVDMTQVYPFHAHDTVVTESGGAPSFFSFSAQEIEGNESAWPIVFKSLSFDHYNGTALISADMTVEEDSDGVYTIVQFEDVVITNSTFMTDVIKFTGPVYSTVVGFTFTDNLCDRTMTDPMFTFVIESTATFDRVFFSENDFLSFLSARFLSAGVVVSNSSFSDNNGDYSQRLFEILLNGPDTEDAFFTNVNVTNTRFLALYVRNDVDYDPEIEKSDQRSTVILEGTLFTNNVDHGWSNSIVLDGSLVDIVIRDSSFDNTNVTDFSRGNYHIECTSNSSRVNFIPPTTSFLNPESFIANNLCTVRCEEDVREICHLDDPQKSSSDSNVIPTHKYPIWTIVVLCLLFALFILAFIIALAYKYTLNRRRPTTLSTTNF